MKQQQGFGHVGLIVLVLAVAFAGVVGLRVLSAKPKSGSGSDNTAQQTAGDQPAAKVSTEPDIALQNVGVTLNDDILFTTQATREFTDKGLKGFYVFGDALSGGRQNPNFEFAALKENTKVVAAIDGVVAFIKDQPESNDSEVFVQPKEGSKWTVGYDHLVNLSVKKGDMVKAGDPLGQPARQNNGMRRFEIQINKDENGVTTHVCPSTLLASDVKDKVLANLASMQNNWEQVTGFDLYDLTKQNPVGCLKPVLTPAEAEGK